MSPQPEAKFVEPAAPAGPVVTPLVGRGGEDASPPRLRQRRPARSRRRWLVFAGLVLLLVAAGGGWYWWSAAVTPADRYVTATVRQGDIEDTITATGTVQPLEYVDVGTQISGQLRTLHVEIGQKVKQGDLLAEIDPTIYRARVDADKAQLLNLKAQLADKRAQLILARQQLQRQTNLMKANATSRDALQSAQATMASAAAQVDALKAQIQNTESVLKGDEANLGYTRIVAPMAGTVVSETARRGQTLNANQQAPIILRIADLSTMTVWTQVSEADVSRLRLGMPVYFTTLGQPDRRWHGALRQILPTPEVVNNVVLYDALFDVRNATGDLLPQMTAQVFFVAASARDALTVPVAALEPAGNRQPGTPPRYFVRVLNDDGTVTRRPVQVGVMNRVSAQIVQGVKAGERVIVGTRPVVGSHGQQRGPGRRARLS